MKRYLIPILVTVLILTSGVLAGCGGGLQTFSKYGISFEVPKDLRLLEYDARTNYNEGCVVSTEMNFVFMWLKLSELTLADRRLAILSTPDIFESFGASFQPEAQITGDLTTQRIADFEVTFAEMQFTLPEWKASGITAVWYCPASQRAMQLVLVNRKAEREMRRFIRSFSCAPAG